MPVALGSLVLTTLTTFAIETSLRTAAPVEVTKGLAAPEAVPLPQHSSGGSG